VRCALETLPWVVEDSVEADIRRQRVRFAVTDKRSFDLEQVRRVIEAKGFRVGKVVADTDGGTRE
jgi:hypothetical protein